MDRVPASWWRQWQPYKAALLYGGALGLGITTQIAFSAFYILCAWCHVKGDGAYGALLMATYGAARAFVLLPVSWRIYRDAHSHERLGRLLSKITVAWRLRLALGHREFQSSSHPLLHKPQSSHKDYCQSGQYML